MHHALTISLIRTASGMSMSDYSKEVVAMSEGDIERIIRSKPFPYGTVTLSEIRSRVYPHIQYTTTLKDYARQRHASKLCLVGHLHHNAQTRVCLHEDAHRFHVADLASYHVEVYAEMHNVPILNTKQCKHSMVYTSDANCTSKRFRPPMT